MERVKAGADQKVVPPCDWCDKAAALKTAVYPNSPIYVYACYEHEARILEYEEVRPTRRRFR